jgi:NAD(P)-dependent dehydrogenase (short-subunit alcohol dehydrogenase family)
MNKRKIILTGSEGVIGKSLISDFLSIDEVEIICIDQNIGFDLTDEDQVVNVMKANSDAEYIVNLFAINDHIEKGKKNPNLFEISLDSIKIFCEVNLVALFSVCRAFVRYTKSPKSILNFSSHYGVRSPKKFIYDNTEKHIGYTITKHGVIGLTRHLATHLSPVRVNCLAPGGVLHKQDKNFIKKYSENVPLNRMMNASELTGLVDLLCSEKSSYITGAIIPIDGGWTAW